MAVASGPPQSPKSRLRRLGHPRLANHKRGEAVLSKEEVPQELTLRSDRVVEPADDLNP